MPREWLEDILAQVGDAIFLLDESGACLEVNPGGCGLLGYTRGELLELELSQWFPLDGRAQAASLLQDLMSGSRLSARELNLLRKDGAVMAVELSGGRLSSGPLLVTARDIGERKLAEQSARELAAQWQATFDASSDAILLLAADQRILRSNRAMHQLIQKSAEEIRGRYCWEVLHCSEEALPACPFNATRDVRRSESAEIQWRDRWLDVTVDPVYNEDGVLLAVIHVIRDVTERKRTEAALLESKLAAERYLNISAGIILSLDTDGTIVHLNESGYELLEYAPAEIIGRNWFDTCLPDDERSQTRRFFEMLKSGEAGDSDVYENAILTRSGRQKTILWRNTILKDRDGRFAGTLSSGEDITERIEMEAALRIALAKYKTLFESFPLGITIADKTGRVLESNPTAEQLLSVPRDEHSRRYIDGAEWRIVRPNGTPMPPGEFASMRALNENRLVENVEMGILKPDQSITWLSVTAAPLPLEGYGVVVAYGDITARKQIESLLRTRIALSQFAETHSLDELLQQTLDEAEALTGSQIGFAHFLDADQKTLVLQTWSTNTLRNLRMPEGSGLHDPVDQAGVWAECVYERAPVVHNDYASLPNRKGLPQGHAPVIRELVVPVIRGGLVVAILGVGNKPSEYNEGDVQAVQQLADQSWDIFQRKRVEEAIRDTEKKYKALIENAPDGIVLIDLAGSFQYVSPSARRIFGYGAEEDIRDRPNEATHPDDLPRVLAAIQTLVSDPMQVPTLQYRFRHKDGSWRWVESTFSNLLTVPGVNAIVVNFRDITEVRETHQALRESEEKYRQLFDLGADAFFLIDNETGRIQDANHVAAEWYGYSRGELLQLRNVDLSAEPDQTRKATLLGLARIPIRYHRKKDGTVFPVEITASHLTYKGRPVHIAAIRDISERLKAEQALVASEEKFRSLVEQSPDGIIIVDEGGLVVEWNRGQERLSGIERSSALGHPIWEVQYQMQPDELRTAEFIERIKQYTLGALRHGQGRRFNQPWEAVIQLPDNSRRIIEVVMYSYHTEIGYRLGSISRDVTERKQVEQRLEYLAMHDELTGLPNRQLFHDRLVLALERARREQQGLVAVMLLDLDNFKDVNDTHGHACGDELLRSVARRLSMCLRKSDTAARMGGDEFTIIVEEAASLQNCTLVAQKVLATLSEPMEIEGHVFQITASLGISLFPGDSEDVETLLRQADIAMYRAKKQRNDVQFYANPS
ncbi:MAG: PAS domain S-box protein [Chloroflexota bacterium]